MFLHLSVILYTKGGLYMMSLPVWLPGTMFLLGVSVPSPMFLLEGVSVRGEVSPSGQRPHGQRPSLLAATEAGGTHPTC